MSDRMLTGRPATMSAVFVCLATVAHAQASVDPARLAALHERLDVVLRVC